MKIKQENMRLQYKFRVKSKIVWILTAFYLEITNLSVVRIVFEIHCTG